jgi:squalene-hopene/tetraprenyl-beta-curcumene cyclase
MSIRPAGLLRNSRKMECGAGKFLIRLVVRAAPLALLTLAVAPAFCADWNAQLAERYMDARQKEWVAWPIAMHSGVACVSCHTGLTYLLARPALRQALGEKTGPTLYEGVLDASIRATVIRTDANDLFAGLKGPIIGQVYGAQVVVAALVMAMDDAPRGKLSAEGEKAFDRLWSLQLKSGPDKGAWPWSDFDLDPWETKDSAFYGAALAALATGMAPAEYQARPAIQENIAAMRAYLREGQKTTPLHNRVFLLWASSKLRDLLPAADKQAILDELWRKQQPDGGWNIQSLGQWKQRDAAPAYATTASNSYATALITFAAEQAGVQTSQASLSKALAWLRTHQDPKGGYWAADSLNHKHEAGTVPEKFMTDAATGYATAALLAAGDEGIQRTASSSKPRN